MLLLGHNITTSSDSHKEYYGTPASVALASTFTCTLLFIVEGVLIRPKPHTLLLDFVLAIAANDEREEKHVS